MQTKKTRILKRISLFLSALMLLTTFPMAALAAIVAPVSAESATAASIQLRKIEGDVTVTGGSKRSLSVRENMRLYNGYGLQTQESSYAWIDLDDAKLAKVDAVSEVEVRKSGKLLELLVDSGNLFFNVSEPLARDETLTVRTSTMVVGRSEERRVGTEC